MEDEQEKCLLMRYATLRCSLKGHEQGRCMLPVIACAWMCRKASNALATRDNGELKHGIDLSKRLQRAILE